MIFEKARKDGMKPMLGAVLAKLPRMNSQSPIETSQNQLRRVNIQLVGEDAAKFEEFMQSRGIQKNANAASALVEEALKIERNRDLVVEIPEETADCVKLLMEQERYKPDQAGEFVTNVIRTYWREWGESRQNARHRIFGPRAADGRRD